MPGALRQGCRVRWTWVWDLVSPFSSWEIHKKYLFKYSLLYVWKEYANKCNMEFVKGLDRCVECDTVDSEPQSYTCYHHCTLLSFLPV